MFIIFVLGSMLLQVVQVLSGLYPGGVPRGSGTPSDYLNIRQLYIKSTNLAQDSGQNLLIFTMRPLRFTKSPLNSA